MPLVLPGEPADTARLGDAEHADDLVPDQQRHVDPAAIAVLLEIRELGGRDAHVIDVMFHRHPGEEEPAEVAALGKGDHGPHAGEVG